MLCVCLAVVPPGYYVPEATMEQCPAGSFREGWVMHSDPKAATCTLCGDNIGSEPRDLDENPKAQNGSLVRATSASCCEFCIAAAVAWHRHTPACCCKHGSHAHTGVGILLVLQQHGWLQDPS